MACSLAARIAAAEAKVEIDLAYVDLATKQLADGGSYLKVNPLGQVSTLRLPNGVLLSETSAVLMWLQAHANPVTQRITSDSEGFYELLRWIGFCATELHKQMFRMLFYPEATDPVKARIRTLAPARFALLDDHLKDRQFLVGEDFSAADAYLIWALHLVNRAQLDPSGYPALRAYQQRLSDRTKVAEMVNSDAARMA